MKIWDIIHHLESIAAPEYQEDYDNSGLIAGDTAKDCTGVLLSLDCTEQLVREAVEKKCNLIVSHHPLIFGPIRRITPANGTGKALIAAIQEDIAIYAIHTNLDNIVTGVNATIADKLGLGNRKILLPKPGHANIGSGMIGDLKKALSEEELLKALKETLVFPSYGIVLLPGNPFRGLPFAEELAVF
jgi:dinuclear metal center YbgI/SA1388 family protein